MQEDEFDDFVSYFVDDYAREISDNFRISPEAAMELAKTELAIDLPERTGTNAQFLFCIVEHKHETANHIGYIWYKLERDESRAFVCDFHILPSYQNRGLGKQALDELDVHFAKCGVNQIRLRVATDNKRALHVYESTGFRATGINMFKEIKG